MGSSTGSFEPTPQKPQKHGIFGTFRLFRAEPGCRVRTENFAAEGFIPLGISVKGKSVTMILPIKNEGIFIVTLGFFRSIYTVIFMPD